MDLRWRSLIMNAGIAILLIISVCEAGSKSSSKTPAHTLADQTGAAHFEERYEEPQRIRHRLRKRASDEDLDYEVYQGVVGRPGIDFPILPRIPQTTFSCRTFGNGYFADLETECQVFHICEEGRKISFLCPNGTIFQQSELTCDWWFKVNCAGSPGLYAESSEMLSRAQNRAKQRTQSSKNEFHSAERDYSHERNGAGSGTSGNGYKNQYPVKTGSRKPSQQNLNKKKPFNRRIDSDEVPSAENFDFEDISSNRESLERPSGRVSGSGRKSGNGGTGREADFKETSSNRESLERPNGRVSGNGRKSGNSGSGSTSSHDSIKLRVDTSLETQDVAESGSFFGNNKNSKQQRNGYIYENPNGNEKKSGGSKNHNEGHINDNNKLKESERGRHRFDGEARTRGSSTDSQYENNVIKGQQAHGKSYIGNERKPSSGQFADNGKLPISNTSDKSTGGGNSGSYTTSRKFETSGTTAFYTPTVPSLGSKITKSISLESRTTTDKNSYVPTTRKPSGNLGFSFDSTTSLYDIPTTVYPSNGKTVTTTKTFGTGIQENGAATQHNTIFDGSSKTVTNNYGDHSKSDITTYSPGTISRFTPRPTYSSKLTTTENPLLTASTSGPTYLPRDSTTYRPSSSGPTYLPTTLRPSSTSLTYLSTSPTPRTSKSQDSVTAHVKDMIKTLNDLNVDTKDLDNDVNKYLGKSPRPGLEIPPSSGPETLASLASYFAGDDELNKTASSFKSSKQASTTLPTRSKFASTPGSASSLTTAKPLLNIKAINNIESGLLTNKTVDHYDKLFGLKTNPKTTAGISLPNGLSPEFSSRLQDDNDLEGQHSNGPLGDSAGKPETRKIAKVFTNALSAYLEDPVQFKRVLTEVRPTEPPKSEEFFVTGAPASRRQPTTANYRASTFTARTIPTIVPSTISSEDLEILDFSDQTTKSKGKFTTKQATTYSPATSTILPNYGTRGSNSRSRSRTTIFPTTTESNDIAAEINKGLDSSTIKPISLLMDLMPPEFDGLSASTQLPLSFDLLPPGNDDDLQRAQSQSFVPAHYNKLSHSDKSDRIGKVTKLPGHYITGRVNSFHSTTTDIPDSKTTNNPWSHLTQTVYLNPLTINDGLMNKQKTTTSSPFTYLPKSTTPTTITKPSIHLDVSSKLSLRNNYETLDSTIHRTPKTFISGISEDLLPPKDGMKRIAVKMFGGLNETQADHLMNVMKKAESNQVVRRLILLLIQTCDEDYGKTVEQSRQALLNALIGMDGKYDFDDEIEVIKLKPRRQKSIGAARRGLNIFDSTTVKIPVTTYRRSVGASRTTTNSPRISSTTDYPRYSTTSRSEDTTRFEIRVEDPEDYYSTSTVEPIEQGTSTVQPEASTSYYSRTTTTSDYGTSTTSKSNLDLTTAQPSMNTSKAASRRKAKHLEGFLGQESENNNSHKSSDERALELLKSLYSLASKFGRR